MRLIRIGLRVFNISALVEAEFIDAGPPHPPVAYLFFAAPEGSGADGESEIRPYKAALYGGEALSFEKWLEDNSENLPHIDPAPAPVQADDNIPF